jgi:hypothetical protein
MGPLLRSIIQRTEHEVEALWLTSSEEIQEGAISKKMMASIYWYNQGIIMVDYLEQGPTINDTYYADELGCLRQEIARKMRGKLTEAVLLLHDNAPAHTSEIAMAAANNCSF